MGLKIGDMVEILASNGSDLSVGSFHKITGREPRLEGRCIVWEIRTGGEEWVFPTRLLKLVKGKV